MLCMRLISSNVGPGGTFTVGPPVYLIAIFGSVLSR